jgi:predicted flap endonuclease-1-like 5' DNA nuclease
VQIRFVGPQVVRRLVAQYEWSSQAGWVQEVTEAGLVAELLTEPTGNFVVDAAEPLLTLKGVGVQRAAELALVGIGTLGDLAALDGAGIQRLAVLISGSSQQVRAWVRQAQGILNQSVDEDQEVAG